MEVSKRTPDKNWFSYSPDDGYQEHATREEARANAKRAIDMYRDEAADEGRSGEVWDVHYGAVIGHTVETVRKARPPAEELDEEGVDQDGTY